MKFLKRLFGLDIPKGHKRIEGATRGRLYTPIDPRQSGGNHIQNTKIKNTKLVGIRLLKADGTIETIKKPEEV